MREDRLRISLIALGILLISAGHYFTPRELFLWHNLFQRLYFLPVVLAALTFGWRGGLLAAAGSALCYVPHIAMTWRDDQAYTASQYAEIVLFFLVATLTGILSDRERSRRKQLAKVYGELQSSFEQLKRADRLSAVGQLAAGLAHEIRNPLASIEGAVDILEHDQGAPDRRSEFLAIIRKEVQRLNGLLTGLLDFARPRQPRIRSIDVNAVIERVASLAEHTGGRKGVSIDVQPAHATPAIEGDPEQLQQVILNLTLNAIQAMPDGGRIVLAAKPTDSEWIIQVVDEGTGIEGENLDKIFDPFYTTKSAGTGLGLAVANQIVTQHGGFIDARRNPGRGMTFSVHLPSQGPAPVAQPLAPGGSPPEERPDQPVS